MIMPFDTHAGTLFNYVGKPARVLGDGGRDVGKGGLPLVAVAIEDAPTCWSVIYVLERDFDRDMVPVEATNE